MFLETIKSPGLAQLSYLLGDEYAGVCAVIDPRRDVQIYIDQARQRECRIVAALETHIHADFVSGARELDQLLDVSIYGGKSEDYQFDLNQLQDKATLKLGALTITCLHTPGHSPEHMCYLVKGGEGAEENWGLFTGDTLFAGSVGRPDLASGSDPEELASSLYESINEKLVPLGEGIIVYPGHGSGSPCGGSIGDRDQTSLGYEAEHNDKLDVSSESEFIDRVMEDLPDEPAYYNRLKKINAKGARLTGGIPCLPPLSPEMVHDNRENWCLLDLREVTAFASAHIPGAINLALRASFPPWAGRILPDDKPVVLIGDPLQHVFEAQKHLYRMGFDNLTGYLIGGMRTWIEQGLETGQSGLMPVHQLEELRNSNKDFTLLDVRTDEEWEAGRLPGATHAFAGELEKHIDDLPKGRKTVVYCGSDYRAGLSASLLENRGFQDVSVLLGSVKAWKSANLDMEK